VAAHAQAVAFVLIVDKSLIASCFQLKVDQSVEERYQLLEEEAAQSLVWIDDLLSSPVLVQLVFDSLVLSALVKNRFVVHSTILSEVLFTTSK
jgi:hypothetical protein